MKEGLPRYCLGLQAIENLKEYSFVPGYQAFLVFNQAKEDLVRMQCHENCCKAATKSKNERSLLEGEDSKLCTLPLCPVM